MAGGVRSKLDGDRPGFTTKGSSKSAGSAEWLFIARSVVFTVFIDVLVLAEESCASRLPGSDPGTELVFADGGTGCGGFPCVKARAICSLRAAQTLTGGAVACFWMEAGGGADAPESASAS